MSDDCTFPKSVHMQRNFDDRRSTGLPVVRDILAKAKKCKIGLLPVR